MKLINRNHYLDKLINVIGTPDIKVITGVRRVGKSKLLEAFRSYIEQNIPDFNVIQINFNLPEFDHLLEYKSLYDYTGNVFKVWFTGNAPTIALTDAPFDIATATVYYPANNSTWTSSVRKNYGGTLTWVSYDPATTQLPTTTNDCGTQGKTVPVNTLDANASVMQVQCDVMYMHSLQRKFFRNA